VVRVAAVLARQLLAAVLVFKQEQAVQALQIAVVAVVLVILVAQAVQDLLQLDTQILSD
jgi:hypothetical protein